MPCRGGSGSTDDKCMDDGDCVSACECVADVHRINSCQGFGSTTGYCDATNPALTDFLFEKFCDCVKKPGNPGLIGPGGVRQSECYASGGPTPGPVPTDGPAPAHPGDGTGSPGAQYNVSVDYKYKLVLDTIKLTGSSEPVWAGAHEIEVTCVGSDGTRKTTDLPGVDNVGVLYEVGADIATAFLPLESDRILCAFRERDLLFLQTLATIVIKIPPAATSEALAATSYSESAGSVDVTYSLTRLAAENVTISCDAACGPGVKCDALVATALTVHPRVASEEFDRSPEIHIGCAKTLADLQTREYSADGLFVTEDLAVTEGRYRIHRTLWTDAYEGEMVCGVVEDDGLAHGELLASSSPLVGTETEGRTIVGDIIASYGAALARLEARRVSCN